MYPGYSAFQISKYASGSTDYVRGLTSAVGRHLLRVVCGLKRPGSGDADATSPLTTSSTCLLLLGAASPSSWPPGSDSAAAAAAGVTDCTAVSAETNSLVTVVEKHWPLPAVVAAVCSPQSDDIRPPSLVLRQYGLLQARATPLSDQPAEITPMIDTAEYSYQSAQVNR